jgi:rod shape determining protein RodA
MTKFWKSVQAYFKKTDWTVWICCLLLTAIGILLFIGLLRTDHSAILNISRRSLQTQFISLALGVVLALLLSLVNHNTLVSLWKYYVPLTYLLFLATFIFGVATPMRPDAKRWLIVPFVNMSIQPSEFLRLAFIMSFAWHIQKVQKNIHRPLHMLGLCVHGFVPVALIQLQGDSGTALLLGMMFLSMLFMVVSWKYMIVAPFAFLGVAWVLWNFILNPFQKARIVAVFASDYTSQFLYQQTQATRAFASGGLFGNGIFSPYHTYVPEMHNDFIFAFLGNAFGFMGCVFVMLLFITLCTKILRNCFLAKDLTGRLICVGVFAMVFFQAFFNIGMALSILPVIGNSLPFVSSGGSSLLANYIGMGLVMSVYMHTARKKRVEDFRPV